MKLLSMLFKSVMLFIAVVLVAAVVIGHLDNNSHDDGGTATTRDQTAPRWKSSRSRDVMSGHIQGFANSPKTTSIEHMAFPYNDLEAWLGFSCKGEEQSGYVGFSDAVNAIEADTYEVDAKVKWDNQEVEPVTLEESEDDRFLLFREEDSVIAHIRSARTAILEIPWFGAGRVHFKFSLAGSSAAIARALSTCHQSNKD